MISYKPVVMSSFQNVWVHSGETLHSSYDYDAPLSESGQYTAKYNATREMIASYDPLYDILRFSGARIDMIDDI